MKPSIAKLEFSPAHNQFRIFCSEHKTVELSDEEQEAFFGLDTSQATNWPATCPKCVKEKEQALKDAQRMTEIREAKKSARIPKRFLKCGIDNWIARDDRQGKVLAKCEVYVDLFSQNYDEGTGMIFAGPPGTGKTHMGCAIINETIALGFRGMYTTGLAMKQAVQETYNDKSAGDRTSAVNSFIHPNLLVVDEIDLLHASEDAQLILWEVISGRYNEVKPTIIISNLTKQELTEQLGGRIIDRLAENKGQFIAFDWESHRRHS
jgi:DNA replication protein DnaC